MKFCNTCSTEKDLDQFNKRTASKDGFSPRCKPCTKAYLKKYYQDNKEQLDSKNKVTKKRWVEENREHVRAKGREYDFARREKVYEYRALRKEHIRSLENASHKKRYQANPGKYKAKSMLRHATKLQATPSWLTAEHLKEIQIIYSECPAGYHIDHIIPLQGEEVRGLHVPWNLQAIPALENLKKSTQLPTSNSSGLR